MERIAEEDDHPSSPTPMLVDWDSAPRFVKHNEFIRTGFRVGHNFTHCFESIGRLHNETGNIWTHLVGFLIIIGMCFCFGGRLMVDGVIVWCVFFASSLCCMFFSTVYHVLNCHSEETQRVSILFDYFGISFLIVGSFYPPIYFVFSCHPAARITYLVSITVFGGCGMVGPCFPFFFAESFNPWRNALFTLMAASGLVPLIHAHIIIPFEGENVFTFLGIYAMYACYGMGLFFYLSKIPERWYPGRFDLWFHSHQIWHVMVLSGAVAHFYNCVCIYERWKKRQEEC